MRVREDVGVVCSRRMRVVYPMTRNMGRNTTPVPRRTG